MIEGGSLRGDIERLNRYIRQLLEGLVYMHSEKIIHGDLKPDNILLSLTGDQLKISDFGLTTTSKSVLERYRSGDDSVIHFAPELRTNNTRSRNIDMYSFGVVIFEMCFGPFQSNAERIKLLDIIRNGGDVLPTYMHHVFYGFYIDVSYFKITF